MTLESPPVPPRHDYCYFDLVRALSAQAVLVGHALNLFLPAIFMRAGRNGMLEGRSDMFVLQNLGVGAFFIISGYLVTLSALRTHRRRADGFGTFIEGRFRRVYGPLLPLLLLLFVVEQLIYPPQARLPVIVVDADAGSLAINLLLLVDHPLMAIASRLTGWSFLHASALGTAAQLWTVFIEWWIYVLFGAVFFTLAERRLTPIRLLAFLVALPVPLYWLTKGNALPLAWLVGMSFAFADDRLKSMSRIVVGTLCAACLGLAVARILTTTWSLYDPIFLLGFSAAVMFGFYTAPDIGWRRGGWADRAVRHLSDQSYSLYLVHLSILIAMTVFVPTLSGLPGLAVGIVLANAAAHVFHLLFERRWLTTKR